MRRKSVSAAELERIRSDLEADYEITSWEIDAGPKMLKICAPSPVDSNLHNARARSAEHSQRSAELLHGRDDLAPAPEATNRRAPEWSELWPSSRAMAAYFGHCVRMRSVDAVDVCCGLGAAGLGAAAKGARVELLHHDPEALRFAKYNAMQNAFPHNTTRVFDWKNDQLQGHVGSLIFADVLYTEENFDHVFRMLEDNLTPGRTAFLAEPGRLVATSFFDALRKTDYRVRLDMERVEDVHSENYYLVSILRIKKDD